MKNCPTNAIDMRMEDVFENIRFCIKYIVARKRYRNKKLRLKTRAYSNCLVTITLTYFYLWVRFYNFLTNTYIL